MLGKAEQELLFFLIPLCGCDMNKRGSRSHKNIIIIFIIIIIILI